MATPKQELEQKLKADFDRLREFLSLELAREALKGLKRSSSRLVLDDIEDPALADYKKKHDGEIFKIRDLRKILENIAVALGAEIGKEGPPYKADTVEIIDAEITKIEAEIKQQAAAKVAAPAAAAGEPEVKGRREMRDAGVGPVGLPAGALGPGVVPQPAGSPGKREDERDEQIAALAAKIGDRFDRQRKRDEEVLAGGADVSQKALDDSQRRVQELEARLADEKLKRERAEQAAFAETQKRARVEEGAIVDREQRRQAEIRARDIEDNDPVYAREIAKLEGSLRALQRQIEQEKAESERLLKLLDEANLERKDFQDQVEDLVNRERKENLNKVEFLNNELEDALRDEEELERDLDAAKEEIQRRTLDHNKSIQSMLKQMKELDERQRKEFDALQNDMERQDKLHRDALTAKEKEISVLIEDHKKAMTARETEIKALHERHQKEMAEKNDEIAKIREAHAKEVEALAGTIAQLRDHLAQSRRENRELKDRYQDVKKQFEAAKIINSRLNREVAHLNVQIENLERIQKEIRAEYATLHNQHEGLKGDHKDLNVRYNQLSAAYDQINRELQDLKQAHAQLQNAHLALQQAHKQLQDDYGHLRDDYGKLQIAHGKLRQEHDALQQNYDALALAHAALQKQLLDERQQHQQAILNLQNQHQQQMQQAQQQHQQAIGRMQQQHQQAIQQLNQQLQVQQQAADDAARLARDLQASRRTKPGGRTGGG